jgi:hypothetical protein
MPTYLYIYRLMCIHMHLCGWMGARLMRMNMLTFVYTHSLSVGGAPDTSSFRHQALVA